MSVTFIDYINGPAFGGGALIKNGAVPSQGSVLFYVRHSSSGAGSLRVRHGKTGSGELHSFVLAGGVPVLSLRQAGGRTAVRAGCGLGRPECGPLSAALKAAVVPPSGSGVKEAFKSLSGLFECLDTGFYLLSFIDHYPVGLTGGFFGGAGPGYEPYKFHYAKSRARAFPTYLAPSASSAPIDAARVEFYRNRLRSGVYDAAIAFYFDDFLSVVLKGHHRAAAAYMEGLPVKCLTILPCSGYAHDGKTVTTLFFASLQFDASLVHPEFLVETMNGREKMILTEAETLAFAQMGPVSPAEPLSMAAPVRSPSVIQSPSRDLLDASAPPPARPGNVYPPLKIIEGVSLLKDLSDETIKGLLNSPSPDFAALEITLDVLIGTGDPRAYELAFRLAGSETYMGLWHAAFSHLAGFRNSEVEDLFVNYLIDDERALADITAIVDAYLEGR